MADDDREAPGHRRHRRRDETFARKAALLAVDDRVAQGAGQAVDSDEALDALDDHIGDDLLRLVFTSCHPALSLESRVALTLKCLAGLSTEEIVVPSSCPNRRQPSASCAPSGP